MYLPQRLAGGAVFSPSILALCSESSGLPWPVAVMAIAGQTLVAYAYVLVHLAPALVPSESGDRLELWRGRHSLGVERGSQRE